MLLCAMACNQARYASIGAADVGDDASVAYVIALWSIVDPYARYNFAVRTENPRLVQATEDYFVPWDLVHQANPQEIVSRGDDACLPPLLVVQGTADANIDHGIPQRFAETYAKAGGHAEYEAFPGMPHQFAREPGPETDRAISLMKSFIARQVHACGGD
jgi:acetyl esterase/lipase